MKNIIVFYHKDCPDGFGAAWSAWKKFGKKAEYIGLEPRRIELPELKNKQIYFLDVLCSEKKLRELVKANKRVTVIDHHESRADYVNEASEAIFSLKNSAAVLSWKYFYPRQVVPKLLLFIEDYDLWRFKRAGSKELMAALDSYKFDFNAWEKLSRDLESPSKRKKYFEQGRSVIGFLNQTVERLVKKADEVVFKGKRALVVNSPILESEIGHYIIEKKKFPIGIIWSYQNKQIAVSLRSRRDVNAARIAKKFGGGGHAQAAGFKLGINQKFPWKKIK